MTPERYDPSAVTSIQKEEPFNFVPMYNTVLVDLQLVDKNKEPFVVKGWFKSYPSPNRIEGYQFGPVNRPEKPHWSNNWSITITGIHRRFWRKARYLKMFFPGSEPVYLPIPDECKDLHTKDSLKYGPGKIQFSIRSIN